MTALERAVNYNFVGRAKAETEEKELDHFPDQTLNKVKVNEQKEDLHAFPLAHNSKIPCTSCGEKPARELLRRGDKGKYHAVCSDCTSSARLML